jgi:uncharacterized protein (TIGR02594 family)
MTTKPKWLEVAELELLAGIREIPGSGDNPRIVEYLRSTTLAEPWASNDETAWCAAFVCWCIERAGRQSTDSAWARGFLRWGVGVSMEIIPHGAIVILKRGREPQPGPETINAPGHVGFFVGWADPTRVLMLSGNQANAVNVSAYDAARVIGVRWAA